MSAQLRYRYTVFAPPRGVKCCCRFNTTSIRSFSRGRCSLPIDTAVMFLMSKATASDFTFNLDYMTFYNLIRSIQWRHRGAYKIIRNHTSRSDAFFDVIDRSSRADSARDEEMSAAQSVAGTAAARTLTSTTASGEVCGSEACDPCRFRSVRPRIFLWQRDPFQLAGGVNRSAKAPDRYILPYWMARITRASEAVEIGIGAEMPSPGSLARCLGRSVVRHYSCRCATIAAHAGGLTLSVTDSGGRHARRRCCTYLRRRSLPGS